MNFDPAFADQRVAYEDRGLDEADLAADPLAQFRSWYDDAVAAGLPEPNAMTLATVDAGGRPSARIVLLKHVDARGFVFVTNYSSRKGADLAAQPAVALVAHWVTQHRQVGIRGLAERVPRPETAAYFAGRPWGSRIGAWASEQSAPIASRGDLDRRWAELAQRWPDRGRDDDVPVPPHWGGVLVRATEVEFWQGRASRLHDRLVFSATAGTPALDDAAGWRVWRRQP